jgi:hypothetical protein
MILPHLAAPVTINAPAIYRRQYNQLPIFILTSHSFTYLKAVSSSETWVYCNETVRRYIPDDYHLNACCHENLKSHALSCSQQPSTRPHPEKDESPSHPHIVFHKDPFQHVSLCQGWLTHGRQEDFLGTWNSLLPSDS